MMFSIEKNTIGKVQSIALVGQLTGIDALNFRQNFSSIVNYKLDHIQVDLKKLGTVDLMGFNALVMLKNEVENRGRNFSIAVYNNKDFKEYLHLSKLDLNCTKSCSA